MFFFDFLKKYLEKYLQFGYPNSVVRRRHRVAEGHVESQVSFGRPAIGVVGGEALNTATSGDDMPTGCGCWRAM